MELNISVCETAKLMGKQPYFVRTGIRQQKLPIGCAVQNPGGHWTYHITIPKLAAYFGVSCDVLVEELKKLKEKKEC